MGGRPSKPVIVLQTEKKSHRTKAELKQREKSENALLTGVPLKEWPETKTKTLAHKEFIRLKKLLKTIGKDDALNEAVINRYCMLIAECADFEAIKEDISGAMDLLRNKKDEIDPEEYFDRFGTLQGQYAACDKTIMNKRKMLLQIEKENIMTIAAALRAVPKQPEKVEGSKMAQFLKQRAGMNGS